MSPGRRPEAPDGRHPSAAGDPLGAYRHLFATPLATLSGGPLSGMTCAVKDALEIAGLAPGVGSRVAGRPVARETATAVSRLLAAGAAVRGTTNLVEMAFGGWGTSRAVGTPVNPWSGDRPLTPGGSSSGSAVAVASGSVDFALGTDTGGSVRIPAAFCGVTGLRPSPGRVPVEGLVHVAPTLDTIGPLARSASLCARVFSVLCGSPPEVSPDTDRADLAGLRVALPSQDALDRVEPEIGEAFEDAVARLAELGATILDEPIAIDFAGDQAIAGAIIGCEAYRAFGAIAEAHGVSMDPAVVARILAGRGVDRQRYEQALAARRELVALWSRRFDRFDVLALPTLPIAAKPIAEVDEQDLAPSLLTRFVGLADLCALTVPMRPTRAGLPTGLQLVGARGEDERILAVGIGYQATTDWHRREPPGFGAA